jgi:putative transposase
MPRIARVVVPGLPHHVTQRGNRRVETFRSDKDRRIYLMLIGEYADRHRLDVWAYALMPNHVHLVAVPEHNDSLACAIRDAHGMYASYFNRTYGLEGHLWQGRYFSCAMNPDHTTTAVRYVERNPVRAGIVDRAQDYEWSSAAAHCGVRCDSLLPDEFPPGFWPADWSPGWMRVI